jgi:serine/threonine protein phosphatase 1
MFNGIARLQILHAIEPYHSVKPVPRTIAVGDVHGCHTALATLIERLHVSTHDTVVMLGDVIDRGPDSRNCLQQLRDLEAHCRVVCIQGNHEQMLLDALEGRISLQEWLVHGGAETLDSYGPGAGITALDARDVEQLRAWGDVFETDSHFFAHGNYLATRPLDRQPWRDLRWQSLKWHTPEPHFSGKIAVVGHTSNKQGEILNLGLLVCIDTYCHGGGWLTAFDAASGQLLQANQAGDARQIELPPIHPLVAQC